MKRSIVKYSTLLSILTFGFANVPQVLAATTSSAPPTIPDLAPMIENVANIVLPFAAVVAVGMIVYGGYMWMTAGGDASRVKSAQGTLTWAVLGLIFLGIFQIILKIVYGFLAG